MRNTLLILVVAFATTASSQTASEQFVSDLLDKMTLEEKIGQMTLYTSDWDVTGPTLRANYAEDVKSGRCGNLFNAHTVAYNRELQEMAVNESRLGIPLLFGYDVIHGHKTIYPIPLAESCSWDLELIEQSARYAAMEAAASGLNWTFNPMVDIARDPRWGRIAEGAGEDPWLGALVGAARVRGHQGSDLADPLTVMACVKHFAAYGAAQAGRDYHTVDMSERSLRDTYLPPYKAAIEAGAGSVMTSFNEYDGIPVTGSVFLMKQILRDEWGFDGLIVTDYTSINEMIPHGYARDGKHAAQLAINAGIDMDMQGSIYQDHLAKLVEEGSVPESAINDGARYVLMKKHELGLFDDPYRYLDEQRESDIVLSDELKQHAREAGRKSIVLLKNDPVAGSALLPLSDNPGSIAVIGPLADAKEDMLGTWHAAGDERVVVTLLQALRERYPTSEVNYAFGASTETDETSGIPEAVALANSADMVILAVGENYRQSGEAASRSELGLPGAQQQLVEAIAALDKPMVTVIMAGRPLVLSWHDENLPCIVNAWHLGTMAGPAITDVLSGDYNPSGKLTISFPRNVGQIPIFYSMKNTGRPFDANNKYTSKYLDVDNTPLYPFGYGLSYSNFEYSNLTVSKSAIGFGESLEVSVDVTNTGDIAGEEIVQLYIQDLFGSVTRPVRELKGFEKIAIPPGETHTSKFIITSDELRFYTANMEFKAEPGDFKVFVGANSSATLEAAFELKQ